MPSPALSRIGLGTVQFGLPYGITNLTGQVDEGQVAEILGTAARHGIDLLDTAALYGASEEVIGRYSRPAAWRVVTKTEKFADAASAAAAAQRLASSFERSLLRLRRDRVYGLLVHDCDDLLGPFGEQLWRGLTKLRAEGLVAKVGASVYDARQIDGVLDRLEIDLIQIPFNALDQRLARSGHLAKLAQRGIEVHARSAFLQGMLLASPGTIDERFGPLKRAVAGLHEAFRDAGLGPLAGSLAAVLNRPEIDRVVVGVTSVTELTEILSAAQAAASQGAPLDIERWALEDADILNPARWPSLGA